VSRPSIVVGRRLGQLVALLDNPPGMFRRNSVASTGITVGDTAM
jgi:hypothetical protein